MLKILTQYPLHACNTFKLKVGADYYVECGSISDIKDFIHTGSLRDKKILILGAGSNMLFTKNFSGVVLRPVMDSIEMTEKTGSQVHIRAGAGLKWDQLVEWTVRHGYWGIENLSMIPGTVGAAPVQNIGAYGVELQEVVESVETVDLRTGKTTKFTGDKCRFAYRSSLFKTDPYRNHIITYLNLILSTIPSARITYGNVADELKKTGEPGIRDIRDTIMRIRKQKLPDPMLAGNAGSFFKNPLIDPAMFEALHDRIPSIPYYPAEEGFVKIPAAWLIEQTGWKGHRTGDVGTWPSQPLVIVNYGNATGQEILEFSEKIREDVKGKFGILLEREVMVV